MNYELSAAYSAAKGRGASRARAVHADACLKMAGGLPAAQIGKDAREGTKGRKRPNAPSLAERREQGMGRVMGHMRHMGQKAPKGRASAR